MATRLSGFTRVSSLGPIADFMDLQGGSASRALQALDLPVALLEQPDLVIPLREQFRLLEYAARETGDAHFGARLGQMARVSELSAFGTWLCASETLYQAIERADCGLSRMLQTSSILKLDIFGDIARWSIEYVEPETAGRHHNELLAIGFMMDTVRQFAGRSWVPSIVRTAMPAGTDRAALEIIFGTNVSNGHRVSSIEFDSKLLSMSSSGRPRAGTLENDPAGSVPRQNDIIEAIDAVTDLALYEGYPRIDWVAAKIGLTRRSLQRHLGSNGTTFNQLVAGRLLQRAKAMLDDDAVPITEIALDLGYTDPAHFTRAFRRWTGISPRAYRSSALEQ